MEESILELEICFNCLKVLYAKEHIVAVVGEEKFIDGVDYYTCGQHTDKKCDSCGNNLIRIKTSPREVTGKGKEELVIFSDPPSITCSAIISSKWRVSKDGREWLKT